MTSFRSSSPPSCLPACFPRHSSIPTSSLASASSSFFSSAFLVYQKSSMNRSKAAISSRAPRLISTLVEVALESELRLLELLDFLELAVDWLPCEESVLLEPSERELAWQMTKINEHLLKSLFEEGWRVKLGSYLFRESLIGRLCVTRSLCKNTFKVFNLKSCRRQCG